MIPNCVWLVALNPENRRFVRNALEPLGWTVRDLPPNVSAESSTPEGGIEVLVIEAPSFVAEPAATMMPTLWLVSPAGIVPRTAGAGPHEFVRLPAPGAELTARLLALVRAAQIERDLRRSEQEAARAVQRRHGMALTLTHRLGSPLSALIEVLEMLADGSAGAITPQQDELVRLGQSAARHVAERLEEMVDSARAESGVSLEMKLGETDLRPLLQDLQDWAIPRLRGKGQRLAVQMSPRAALVCSDAGRLGQALRHLLENANRFSPPGGSIEIGVDFDPDQTGFVRIVVADDGPGFATDSQERFSDPLAGREGAPFGTGLVLARAIATTSGGDLRVIEDEGRGSSIALCLPAWGSRAARIAEVQARLAAPGALPGPSWVCRCSGAADSPAVAGWPLSPGETILVTDDPPAGLLRLGRVREFREPGSLARALHPRLRFQPLASSERAREAA